MEPLTFEIKKKFRKPQRCNPMDLTAEQLLDILSQHDPYGLWRMEIDSGRVYWSDDTFRIHGMKPQPGPVDLISAINAYHEDDRDFVFRIVEDTVKAKGAFRFVMRLKMKYGVCKLVKSTGKYFPREGRSDELIGTFSEFQPPKRSVALLEAA